MGVDCNLYLPVDVDIRYVSDVIGIAKGADVRTKPLKGDSTYTYYEVSGNDAVSSGDFKYDGERCFVPGLAWLGGTAFFYCATVPVESLDDLPFARGKVFHLLMGASNALTLSVFRRLAETFGGFLFPRDDIGHDDFELYSRPDETMGSRTGLLPEDGEEWERCNEFIYEGTEPITREELVDANEVVAYSWEDDDEALEFFEDQHEWARPIFTSSGRKTLRARPIFTNAPRDFDAPSSDLTYADYREAVEGEGWAITDYKDMIARAGSDREREVLTHIMEEEQEHLDELQSLMGARDFSVDIEGHSAPSDRIAVGRHATRVEYDSSTPEYGRFENMSDDELEDLGISYDDYRDVYYRIERVSSVLRADDGPMNPLDWL